MTVKNFIVLRFLSYIGFYLQVEFRCIFIYWQWRVLLAGKWI